MESDLGEKRPYAFYILIALALGMLFIAVYYILEAFLALQKGGQATYQLMTGLFGLAVSAYMFLQLRRRTISRKTPSPPEVTTVIECRGCGFKRLRGFAKGDYVFRSTGYCEKCDEPLVITGIYVEEAEE